jgi:TolA-binding protein
MRIFRIPVVYLLVLLLVPAFFCSEEQIDADELYAEAEEHFYRGRYDEAYKAYKKFEEQFSRHKNRPYALIMLADLAEVRKDDKELSDKYWEKLLTDYPGHPVDLEYFNFAKKFYSISKYVDTISMYKKVVAGDPDNEKRPEAIFMIGFISANDIKDYDQAKKYYNKLIEEYPENQFVESAKFELTILGKNPEELDKILQSQIKADESKIK